MTSRGGCSEWCPIRPTKGTKRDRADTTHIIRPVRSLRLALATLTSPPEAPEGGSVLSSFVPHASGGYG